MKRTKSALQLKVNSIQGVSFHVAQTEQDLIDALTLLQEVYKEEGLGHQWERMRVTPYHLLPTTTVFVAKKNDRVIGTMSCIGYNEIGLPSLSLLSPDQVPGGWMGEVSSLAIHPEYRMGGQIYFGFCLLAIHYQINYQFLDYSIIAVHPKQARFYKEFIGYQEATVPRLGYEFVQGAPVQVLTNDLTNLDQRWTKKYAHLNEEFNWHYFLHNPRKFNIFLPPKNSITNLHSLLSPSLVYFLLKFLSPIDKEVLAKNTYGFLNHLSTPEYREALEASGLNIDVNLCRRREIRVKSKANVRVFDDKRGTILGAKAISISNAGVELTGNIKDFPGRGRIQINTEKTTYNLDYQNISARNNSVVAMIDQPPSEWSELFSSINHYSISKAA